MAGYLISGHFKLSVKGKSFEVRPGDSWCIPEEAEHKVEFIENSVAIEVFSPIRQEYLHEDTS